MLLERKTSKTRDTGSRLHIDAAQLNGEHSEDHQKALGFLKSYNGSSATFNAYRREVERLLHWAWLFTKKTVKDLEAWPK